MPAGTHALAGAPDLPATRPLPTAEVRVVDGRLEHRLADDGRSAR